MNRPRSILHHFVALPSLPLVLAIAIASAQAQFAFSQPSAADGPWAGSVQCVLDVQTGDYTRQETQTWTLTGDAPTLSGDFRIYNAMWTVTGQGSLKKAQGQHLITTTWIVNVPATAVKVAMFIRASDQKLIIRQWSSSKQVPGAVVGTKRVTVNGQPGPTTQVTAPASEWSFQWIDEDKDQTTFDGTKATTAEALPADFYFSGASTNATCTWQFTMGAGAPPQGAPREPAPQLLKIDPFTIDQGATGVRVTLSGQGTHWLTGTTGADFGPDITVASLTVNSRYDAIAVLNVAASAAIGPRKVTLTTANATPSGRSEEVGLPDTFKVNVVLTAATAPGLIPLPTLPSITQVTPNWAAQGAANVAVTLTGFSTHFVAGTSRADFGPDISAPLNVSSPTSATATLTVAKSAATGPRTVSVTTASEIAKLAGGFTVTRLPPAPPAPVTSENYRIILNGFRVNSRTFEGIETDGPGDEVYAAARVHLCARTGGGVVVAPGVFEKSISEVKTAVHGCIGDNFPGRVRAGSADQFGGLRNGDVFPTGQDPARTTASPIPRTFPFLLWEGQLSDGNEVVIVEPSLWEWDGDSCVYTEWEHETFLRSQQTKDRLHDRIIHADLSPIDADMALGILCFNSYQLPNGSNVCQCQPGKDRPIGLKEGDYQSARFRGVAVAITREAIEKALTSPPQAGGLPPGVITIPLVDEGFNFNGNYDLFLRVERVAEVTAASTPVRPATTTEAREPTADTTPVNVAGNAAPEGTPSTLENAAVVPFSPAIVTPTIAPTITQVTPNSGALGATGVNVTFTGRLTHFAQGTTTANLGPGITVTALTVSPPTGAMATLNIDRSAAPGGRTITLTTGAEVVTLANGFAVTNAPGVSVTPVQSTTGPTGPTVSGGDLQPVLGPVIAQISPNAAAQGAGVPNGFKVALASQLTHWVHGSTIANFGAGVTVTSMTVYSATNAEVLLTIDPGAQLGPRTVTITTGAEVVTAPFGFTVTPPPDSFGKDYFHPTPTYPAAPEWKPGSSAQMNGRLHTRTTEDWFELGNLDGNPRDGTTVTIALNNVQAPSEFDLNLYLGYPESGTFWEQGYVVPTLLTSTASSGSGTPKTIVLRFSMADHSWTYRRPGDAVPNAFPGRGNALFYHIEVSVKARTWYIDKSSFTLLITVQ